MFVVGLTGGIGSGKSAVADRFVKNNITAVDADIVSRLVVKPGTDALAQIGEHFGETILQPDGELDRTQLRARIFADKDAKTWLESLLHPLIGLEVHRQLETAQSPYVLLVSPLLVETGQTAICDCVVVVDVTESVQIERTVRRDSNSEEQVQRIIASQATRERRMQAASDVIDNSGSLAALDDKVDALHQKFLRLASEKADA